MDMDFLDLGSKMDLTIDPPLCNAAGSLGIAPDNRKPVHWEQFGAFFTNPISWQARSPAGGVRFRELPGGFMLHTGLPNPGFSKVVSTYSDVWAHSEMPIVVHLLADHADRLRRMVERVEVMENILAIELGFPPEVSGVEIESSLRACRGELPLIARLPFESAVHLAPDAIQAGAAAVSLSPPRVMLPTEGGFISGRNYGRGVFPQMYERVYRLVQKSVPVIAGGGVYEEDQMKSLLTLGVKAVQVDVAFWRNPRLQIEFGDIER